MLTVGAQRRDTRWRRVLVVYVLIQLSLSITAAFTRGAVLSRLVEVIGTAAFAYGVVRYRPRPLSAWRLVLLGFVLFTSTGIWLGIAEGFRAAGHPAPGVPTGLIVPGQLLIAAGLALMARNGIVRRGPVDVIDAAMAALVAYLLLWLLHIDPALQANRFSVSAIVFVPLGTLLMFTTGARLVLGGALRDRAILLLLIGVLGIVVVNANLVSVALRSGSLVTPQANYLLYGLNFTVIGAVGLYPGLARPRVHVVEQADATSWRRITLFALLVLLPPIVWAAEADRPRRLLVVPALVSAAFLLLLVVRLGLVARLAHHRAEALAASAEEQAELQRELAYRAQHDPLTGLANRAVLTEALVRMLDRQDWDHRPALLLFDLDQFKGINDTWGHLAGDELLVQVAERFRASAPTGAITVRLGGDEFALLLDDADPRAAQDIADRLMRELRQPYRLSIGEVIVSTSVGVMAGDAQASELTPSELLRDADLALYAAKSAGRNRVVLFDPSLRPRSAEELRLRSRLRDAIDTATLPVRYLSIVETETGLMVAVEALPWWHSDSGRQVQPSDVFAAAAESGLAEPLAWRLLYQSLRDAQVWFRDRGVALAVRLAGAMLSQPGFADRLVRLLREYDLAGADLIVELTERDLAGVPRAAACGQLQFLRDNGIRIAIDDVGVGHPAPSAVIDLPIDMVKTDRLITTSLATGPEADDAPPAVHAPGADRSVLRLARSVDTIAIATNVETLEQAVQLRNLGCRWAQGSHYARPVRAELVPSLLAVPLPS